MKYYGPIADPKDVVNKDYVDTQVASITPPSTIFDYDVNGDVMPVPSTPTP